MPNYNQSLRYRQLDILYYGPAPPYIPIATTYCAIPIILRTQRETKLDCIGTISKSLNLARIASS